MEELKDITLKVKLDTYKALQNYLKNELKISKQDLEEMIAKLVEAVVEKQLSENGLLVSRIDKAVRDSISRLSSTHVFNLEKRIDNAIEKAIGERILATVKEQLKGINVSIAK